MVSETSEVSPSWKNPRERLRKHLKRTSMTRSLTWSLENAKVKVSSGSAEANIDVVPAEGVLVNRSNPFKRRRTAPHGNLSFDVSAPTWDDSNANDPFSNEKVLSRFNKLKCPSSRSFSAESDQSFMECLAIDFSDVTCCSASSSTAAVIDSYSSDTIPTDLRLGTKLRVISRKPFLWMKDATVSGVVPVRVIGQQQHEGMQYFLKNIAANFDSTATDSTADSSPMALLEAASLYWQFPCFPWLSTYPRADSLVNTNARTNPTIPTLSSSSLEALDLQWTECFDQLFLSWKKGDRQSFYMSCSSFTVLFTKISFDDVDTPGEESLSCFHASEGRRHVAVIIPCPIGLRHYLKSEGVVYELIRRKHRFKNTKSSEKLRSTRHKDSKSSLDSTGSQSLPPSFSFESKTAADGSQEDHDKENIASQAHSDGSPEKADLSGDHEWLENIGMSPRNTAKLKRYKSLGATSKLNDEDSQSNPGVEEVAGVLVKGAEVQTLYNLLQSSRICRSIAGPHANLPPTLVAAQPFLYAQMNALKKTSQVVRRKVSEYVLELEGPILPHSLPLVAAFIRHTRLCQDDPVIIRVNDRSVCNGMNDVDSDLYDWNELRIDKEKVSWDKI